MTEKEMVEGLARKDVKALKMLVMEYSEQMVLLAYLLTKNAKKASEITDSVLQEFYDYPDIYHDLVAPLDKYFIGRVRAACFLEHFDPLIDPVHLADIQQFNF